MYKQLCRLLLVVMLQSCTSGNSTENIETGKDECHTCKMTIMDLHYGGEVVTQTGKIFKFDSLNCLIDFYKGEKGKDSKVFVLDFTHPGNLVTADSAVFTTIENHANPMGSGIVSFANRDDAAKESHSLLYTWQEVLDKPDL